MLLYLTAAVVAAAIIAAAVIVIYLIRYGWPTKPQATGTDDRRVILYFAVGLSLLSFAFFFVAAFFVTVYADKDTIKTILPFLFSSCAGLWGYYWGSSKGSSDKTNIMSAQDMAAIQSATNALQDATKGGQS